MNKSEIKRFHFNRDTRSCLSSDLQYETIEVSHDDVFKQSEDYLNPILSCLSGLKSLSFKGTFEKPCIDEFFKNLQSGEIQNKFMVENLTFIGDVVNAESLLIKFYEIKEYDSVTLNKMGTSKFWKIFSTHSFGAFHRTKVLNLNNMDLTGAIDKNNFCQQHHIKTICLNETKIEIETLNLFKEKVPSLEAVKTNSLSLLSESAAALFIKKEEDEELFEFENIPRKPTLEPTDDCLTNIHEDIFQHLKVHELLNASEVSRQWFNLSSPAIEKNSMFNLNLDDDARARRRRSYENIFIKIGKGSTTNLDDLKNCKELTIEIDEGGNVGSLFSEQLAACNSMTLLNITCRDEMPLDDMKLPAKLETLLLTKFSLNSVDPEMTPFYQSLTNAKYLNHVELVTVSGLEKLLINDLSFSLQSKLSRLSLPISISNLNEMLVENMTELFKNQPDLIQLNVKHIPAKTLEVIIKNGKLQSLEFEEVKGELTDPTLKLETLTDLKILSRQDRLVEILMFFPKLETIHVACLTRDLCNFPLKDNFPQLKEIQYKKRARDALKGNINRGIKLKNLEF